ncbi:MAG TPA: hypothetical protein VLG71_01185 [Candidatus Limnocylindria bacterium]|nr:hypothetical protein [Candidatus Limnocylindria bacterium]
MKLVHGIIIAAIIAAGIGAYMLLQRNTATIAPHPKETETEAIKRLMLSKDTLEKTMVQLPGAAAPVPLLTLVGQVAFTASPEELNQKIDPAYTYNQQGMFKKAIDAGWTFDATSTYQPQEVVVVNGPGKRDTMIYGIVIDKADTLANYPGYIVQVDKEAWITEPHPQGGTMSHGGWILTKPEVMGKIK